MKRLLVLFSALVPVFAQQPDLFRIWDRNGDGKLSREELPEGARRNL
jgi:hypothetical protein